MSDNHPSGPLQITLGCDTGLRLGAIMQALADAGYRPVHDERASALGVVVLLDQRKRNLSTF